MAATGYTVEELMVSACAREIRDREIVFVGVGIPLLAGMVARQTHAPDAVLLYEGGGVGAVSRRIPWSIADNPTTDNALAAMEMWRVFGDTQRGYVDTGIVGAAQIDKYGNLNTTAVSRGEEPFAYERPAVRLAGSGGGNDIASSCKRVIVVMRLEKRRFRQRVDYITSPGYLDGPGGRERAGLRRGGPYAVVTNKCIFKFDQETKEMYLDGIFPGVEVGEIVENVEWELKVGNHVPTVEPPREEELRVMKAMDPLGIILGSKTVRQAESFEEFFIRMKAGYESVVLDF